MGTINIQSTDLSHKAGLTYTGTSDKTIDVNSLVTKVSSTDNAIVRFDGTSGAVQNSGVIIDDNNYITTRIFNQAGTEFNGIEYADSGIQGVPDTSFSSTGARIYPDGTIRGKSSYGEYVKYPDGRLECYSGLLQGINVSNLANSIFYYPHIFVSNPTVVSTISRGVVNSTQDIGFNGIALESISSVTYWKNGTYGADVYITAIGIWK